MAKGRRSTSEESSGGPTILRVPVADAEAQLRDRVEKASVILSVPINDREPLQQQRAQYYTWDEYNTTLLKRLFSSEELAQEYSYWGIAVVGGSSSLAEGVRDFGKD